MAITVTAVGTKSDKVPTNPLTLYTNLALSAGDYLIVVASYKYNGAIPGYNSNAVISWGAVNLSLAQGSGGSTVYCAIASAYISSGGTNNLVMTWNASYVPTASTYLIYKATGLASSSTKDKGDGTTSSGTTATTPSTGTLSQDNELIIAATAVNDEIDDAHGSWTTGTGYVSGNEQFDATNGGGDSSNVQGHSVARIVTDGTTQAYQGVDGTHDSVAWDATIVTYKGLTAAAPTVTIQDFTLAAQTTITFNGNITDGGGSSITERGVCYNTTGAPTTADSTAHDHTDATGAYTEQMTSLTAGTTYHCKAYAINSTGTGYSTESDFVAPYLHSLLLMGVGI